MKLRMKTYSLYLAKPSVKKLSDVFSEKAKELINEKDVQTYDSKRLGKSARLYIFQHPDTPPKWLDEVSAVFGGINNDIRNKSSSAAIVFRSAKRIFATTFSHSWQYLDDTKIEPDFGLLVAVNSLNASKVRRIDRNHLGEAIKGVLQSANQRDIQSFGTDEALDIIRHISGSVEGSEFAKTISGSTALRISQKMELINLPELAEEALKFSRSKRYKKTNFYIIDKIKPIRDKNIVNRLDIKAVDSIKQNQANFELSMPGWSDDDIVYYGIIGSGLKGRYHDLLMTDYRKALGEKISELDVDQITNKHRVVAEFNRDTSVCKKWSIKKALVGSIQYNRGLYAISEGEWYRLDKQFKEDVDQTFKKLRKSWSGKMLKIKIEYCANNKKTGLESEESYNRRCAIEYDQICLDRKLLKLPSMPNNGFEACDLLDISGKRMIHVKKNSRQSSVLSHFFKQGHNSAKILKISDEARLALRQAVVKESGKTEGDKLKKAMHNDMYGWVIEYHIIDSPRNNGEFMIPFFSRITLRDESNKLKSMQYKVIIRFIEPPKNKS